MNNWRTKQSDHYRFHYFPDSLAEKEIALIVQRKERDWEKICSFLNLENDRIIHYYLYPSNRLKEEKMGDDGNGNAFLDKFEVHAVYNKEIKCIGPHEDVHLLIQGVGLPITFLREGLAEYFEDSWCGYPHNFWVKKFLAKGTLPPIKDLLDDEVWDLTDDMISYSVAGSFVKFLIERYGQNKFRLLYREMVSANSAAKNLSIFSLIIGDNIQLCQKEWLAQLASFWV